MALSDFETDEAAAAAAAAAVISFGFGLLADGCVFAVFLDRSGEMLHFLLAAAQLVLSCREIFCFTVFHIIGAC